jgi:hypothetical protein
MQAIGLQPVLPGRADSLLPSDQPGSAKMVSLDLLMGANSTPLTPRDPDLQLPVRRHGLRRWVQCYPQPRAALAPCRS